MHDHLTGLLNRRGFFSAGREALRRQKWKGENAGMVLLEIDQFKMLNDSQGQQAGDAFLQQLAANMAGIARPSDVIGRLSGNEFAVILPGADEGKSCAVAEALRRAVAEVDIGSSRNVNPMTASAGISTAELGGFQFDQLLGAADLALFLAKSEGRNRSRLFQLEDALHMAEDEELERALSHAVERSEMFVAYQPRVNLVSGRLVGVEALARWRHPTRGMIPPDKFIPRAEACGLISAINAWLLDSACGQMRRWEEAGLGDIILSVNVSAAQLREPGLAELVETTLGRYGLPAQKLVLEVTESIMMTSGGAGTSELRELAGKGIRIAIDDFGTGYSSLSYLRTLPCNYLKIDRSFVSDIPGNKEAVAIAKGVVGMGRSLGLRLIAEGIETQEQADFMRRLWCEEGQGYLFAAPMIGDDFEQWARSRSRREPDAAASAVSEIA
jgi:diguanylate cyclase (GGDEF)-like protein